MKKKSVFFITMFILFFALTTSFCFGGQIFFAQTVFNNSAIAVDDFCGTNGDNENIYNTENPTEPLKEYHKNDYTDTYTFPGEEVVDAGGLKEFIDDQNSDREVVIAIISSGINTAHEIIVPTTP